MSRSKGSWDSTLSIVCHVVDDSQVGDIKIKRMCLRYGWCWTTIVAMPKCVVRWGGVLPRGGKVPSTSLTFDDQKYHEIDHSQYGGRGPSPMFLQETFKAAPEINHPTSVGATLKQQDSRFLPPTRTRHHLLPIVQGYRLILETMVVVSPPPPLDDPSCSDPLECPPLRWGILGCGRVSHDFTQALKHLPTQTIVACSARSLESARAFAEKHGIQKFCM